MKCKRPQTGMLLPTSGQFDVQKAGDAEHLPISGGAQTPKGFSSSVIRVSACAACTNYSQVPTPTRQLPTQPQNPSPHSIFEQQLKFTLQHHPASAKLASIRHSKGLCQPGKHRTPQAPEAPCRLLEDGTQRVAARQQARLDVKHLPGRSSSRPQQHQEGLQQPQEHGPTGLGGGINCI